VRRAEEGKPPLLCNSAFPDDAGTIQQILSRLDPAFDLAEPFIRIRDAITEARKMGAANR